MPSDHLLPLLLILAVLAGLLAWRAHGRARRAEARAGESARMAEMRARCISLAASELRAPGLILLAEGREGMGRQLLRIADDLTLAATEPVARSIREVPLPLGPVVDSVVAKVAATIRPGQRHWRVDPALRGMTVRADRRALEAALSALIQRAAGHSRDGDVVALRHVLASETLAIIVEDEGDGLVAADLEQEAMAAQDGTRGLDLGLSLARSLAAAHGGDIRLESVPGIGARAWLTLPRERLLEAA